MVAIEEIKKGMRGKLISLPSNIEIYGKGGGGGGGRKPSEKTMKIPEAVEKYRGLFDELYKNMNEYGFGAILGSKSDFSSIGIKLTEKEFKGGKTKNALIKRFAMEVNYGGFTYSINDLWKRYLKMKGIDANRETILRVNTIKLYSNGKKVNVFVIYAHKWFREALEKNGISDATTDAGLKGLIAIMMGLEPRKPRKRRKK